MKFKSRPVKVEQPPPHSHPYHQNISPMVQPTAQLAPTTMPITTISTITNSNTWTKSSLTPSQASSPLFSIIPPSASGSNPSTTLSIPAISSLTDTFPASLPLLTSDGGSSVVASAVKALNPIPVDRSSMPVSQESLLSSLSPTIGSNNSSNQQVLPDVKLEHVELPVIRSVSQEEVTFSARKCI